MICAQHKTEVVITTISTQSTILTLSIIHRMGLSDSLVVQLIGADDWPFVSG